MPRVSITVPGKSPQPYRFQLDRRLVSLGRGSNSDIVIDCGSVSVSHAQMCRVEGGYELRDLDSTNGIKLGGERIPVVPLRSGMTLLLGDVLFEFQLSEEEQEALASELPLEDSPIIREAVEEPVLPELPPASAPPPGTQHALVTHAQERPGCATFLWLFILVLVAFVAGMAIRYHRETGDSWLGSVFEKVRILKNGTGDVPAEKPAAEPPQAPKSKD